MAKSKAKAAKTKVAKNKPAKNKSVNKKSAKPAKKPAVKAVAKTARKTAAAKSPVKSAKSTAQSKPLPPVKMATSGAGMKRFSPLDDRIVIERVVGEQRTAGGLYIPDSAQEKPTTGRVVAVGRGHRDAKGRIRPCDVKVGDTVMFTAWAGTEIEVDGTKYVVMREPDLLGVTTS